MRIGGDDRRDPFVILEDGGIERDVKARVARVKPFLTGAGEGHECALEIAEPAAEPVIPEAVPGGIGPDGGLKISGADARQVNSVRVDLRHLAYLAAIFEYRSISAAAVKLGVPGNLVSTATARTFPAADGATCTDSVCRLGWLVSRPMRTSPVAKVPLGLRNRA